MSNDPYILETDFGREVRSECDVAVAVPPPDPQVPRTVCLALACMCFTMAALVVAALWRWL